ncbi:stage V sporulation protein AB [Lachnotalea sp. AF33-28]|nr:stage V sporulation protein AB [Lachnotalea sp. AF33-28]RHP32391.1 stage V sporulation protein AB [Lachnotalea sp. AF33-28]
MFIKQLILAAVGLAAGGIISAGVFAFITIIGLVPRLAARTKTAKHVRLYEDIIVLGATAGNLTFFYHFPIFGGAVMGVVFGLFSGIFVGCLIMSLAETLDTVPTISRRIKLAVGLQYIILSIGLGKCVGSLLYFWYGMAG